jgi:quercetin dioxygenase-like cupin family protein
MTVGQPAAMLEGMTAKHEHQTSGTAFRGPHQMSGRGLVFHLADELTGLRHDLEHTSGGRAAKTLAKSEGLRVTLVLIKKDMALNPEAVAGGASIAVISGKLRVQAEGRAWEVGAGELIVLSDNLREPVKALEETAFLLTVAWPPGAGAWEQELSNGHV